MFRWRPRSRTARIILHSSHFDPSTVPNQTAHLRARGREMGLLEVGYHAVIERDGTVVECRPAEAVGSHCPGNNHDSIGVCLAGDTGHTAAQLAAAVEHCARLQVAFGPLEIRGHTELQRFRGPELRCPAAIDMDDFRRLVADHLAGMELRAPMQTTEPPEDKLIPTLVERDSRGSIVG